MAEMRPIREKFVISHSSHVYAIKEEIKDIAWKIGFDEGSREELALVITELASNLLKYANSGILIIGELNDERGTGIIIESSDQGPGILNAERALMDGFSSAGSLGYGLGTVNRLMDELEIESRCRSPTGTRIICKKWLRNFKENSRSLSLDVGAATRSHPQFAQNGDAFIIKKWDESLLVGVIDGLGHGQFAHRASMTAKRYIENHFDQPLQNIFLGVGRACMSTRGVVMALARFDLAGKKLSFAGIGNIDVRIFGDSNNPNLLSRRGIVKMGMPTIKVLETHWDPDNIMVLYSDGITSHWTWDDFKHLEAKSATIISSELLRKLARDTDDATVVVLRGKQDE
jgi:anti-sigma regulatory factor (Ser/Thr protein kinase)